MEPTAAPAAFVSQAPFPTRLVDRRAHYVLLINMINIVVVLTVAELILECARLQLVVLF